MTGSLQQLSDFLITNAPIIGAVAAIIAIYRFVIKQPALVLKADVDTVSSDRAFQCVHVTPKLFLANEGRDFAEDVYFEMELPDWNFEEDGDDENISTFLDVTGERTGYLGSPRGFYQVNVNKPIQPREEYKMFFGGAKLERNRTYEINYTISCRSYGPREGSIKLHVGHHDVTINNVYPKRRRKYFIQLREFLSGEESFKGNIDLLKMDIDWKSEDTANITALVKNTGTNRLRIAEARFDLFLGEAKSENYWTSIPLSVWGLDPGEFWQIDFEIDIDQPKLSKDDISIDYSLSTNTNHLANGWENVKLVDSVADLPDSSNSLAQVYGRLENLNAGTDRKVRVVAKWIDRNGNLISTDDSRIKLEAGEAEDFSVNCSNPPDKESDIDDYSIALMGG